ncbi:MAG: acyloxyacyl hydrolase [Bacteroidetes bacterium]|nr:acyloxyacyl hydrolase [Bacteroidota bacterium]
MTRFNVAIFILGMLLYNSNIANAQLKDSRGQYPSLLANSYVGVNVGYIQYPFSNDLLKPGYKASSINNPGVALRITLGHEFNKYFSAQISYMRPILWVHYRDVNGDKGEHDVFMNVGGLTGKLTLPVTKRLSVYGEGGLSVVTRAGFNINDTEVASSVNYASFQLCGGVQYKLNKRWNVNASVVYAAGKEDVKQPYTLFYSAGVTYHMRRLSEETAQRNASGGCIFPENLIQVGVSTNALGYGLNYYFSTRPIPIFWDGNVRLKSGVAIQYQRNVFHGRKFFALDWGANVSVMQTELNNQTFFAASLFPLLRFYPLRTKPFDLYFNYALAGPTYISEPMLDGLNTGEHFTFYDMMGMGVFAGRKRHINAEIRIAHYSNGNLFYHNPGVLIPFLLSAGYTF